MIAAFVNSKSSRVFLVSDLFAQTRLDLKSLARYLRVAQSRGRDQKLLTKSGRLDIPKSKNLDY